MRDEEIIQLFFERSEASITKLDEKYGKLCRSVSYNILRNEQDAEECVNDAYFALWNDIPPKTPNPLQAYVCRIVRNLSLKKYRSNTAQKRNSYYDLVLEELSECLESDRTIEDEILAKELSAELHTFLGMLGKKDRVIFVQRYWYCDSIQEIAEKLNMSANAVTVHLHRTRKRLKKYLEEKGL